MTVPVANDTLPLIVPKPAMVPPVREKGCTAETSKTVLLPRMTPEVLAIEPPRPIASVPPLMVVRLVGAGAGQQQRTGAGLGQGPAIVDLNVAAVSGREPIGANAQGYIVGKGGQALRTGEAAQLDRRKAVPIDRSALVVVVKGAHRQRGRVPQRKRALVNHRGAVERVRPVQGPIPGAG